MKKICVFLLMVSLVCPFLTACTNKPKPNMVQSHRRFEKYITPQSSTGGAVVDLSGGPKLNYDRSFGPGSLDFDIKIVNPYDKY